MKFELVKIHVELIYSPKDLRCGKVYSNKAFFSRIIPKKFTVYRTTYSYRMEMSILITGLEKRTTENHCVT